MAQESHPRRCLPVMLGTVTTTEEAWLPLRNHAGFTGQCAGPDDIYLGLRGFRTLDARLRQHQAAGIEVANWLEGRPEILQVLHPALPSHPQHEIWKRDLKFADEQMPNFTAHRAADEKHSEMFLDIFERFVPKDAEKSLLKTARDSMDLHRAYFGGMASAMARLNA